MNSKIKYVICFLCGVLIAHFLVNKVEGFPSTLPTNYYIKIGDDETKTLIQATKDNLPQGLTGDLSDKLNEILESVGDTVYKDTENSIMLFHSPSVESNCSGSENCSGSTQATCENSSGNASCVFTPEKEEQHYIVTVNGTNITKIYSITHGLSEIIDTFTGIGDLREYNGRDFTSSQDQIQITNTFTCVPPNNTSSFSGFPPGNPTIEQINSATVTCADNYNGNAVISPCSNPGDEYMLSGCNANQSFTCDNGTAVSGTTPDSDTENCDSCNTGFIKDGNSCVAQATCSTFDKEECDDDGDYKSDNNCSGVTCTKEECCESGLSPVIIGSIIFGVLCICCSIPIGIFMFSGNKPQTNYK